MREGGKDRDGGRQIRRKTDREKNESNEGDRVCVRERERSLQLCQYAEWEGKETNGERSKKKKLYGGTEEELKKGRRESGG